MTHHESNKDTNTTDTAQAREQLAAAFDRDIDPLAQYAATFDETDIDPFDLFIADVLKPKDLAVTTVDRYHGYFDEWRAFMADQGRHPACPNQDHVRAFIRRELDEQEHTPGTVREKLQKLNRAYEYWQTESVLPHPQDYNPFELAREKVNLSRQTKKPPHNIPLSEVRERVRSIGHVRDRAYIVLPLKLGLRASELTNIQLQDVSLAHPDIHAHYSEIGTHPRLKDRENAIYVPSRNERKGNKSEVARVLPLDDETRQVLVEWLLIRPDNGLPCVFLTKQSHVKPEKDGANNVWKTVFRPDYGETDEHRAVTSHFGRHFFSTYWRVRQDAPREVVKYMRGDKTDRSAANGREAIDEYLHTYYDDVEQFYRENIFKLDL